MVQFATLFLQTFVAGFYPLTTYQFEPIELT